MKKIGFTALTVLAALTLGAQAEAAAHLKKLPTPASLQKIVDKCKTEMKSGIDAKYRKKLACPVISKYKIPADFHGETAAELVYEELGYSLFDTGAGGATDRIVNSMRGQLLETIPNIEDGMEETIDYFQNTANAIEAVLYNAEKGGHEMWKNDPNDHDGREAASMIYNHKTNELIVIEHERDR